MTRITLSRVISAPVDLVFSTVADIRKYSKAIPHIVKFEFLSDVESGVGTKFRETRLMRGREATEDLEVTECVVNDRIRIVSDSHGSVWDTVFSFTPTDGGTTFSMVMDARAYKLLPKLVNPLIKGMIRKEMEKDMDLVKAYCER